MSRKTLVVNLPCESLHKLSHHDYTLCIAKMVNGEYTVVWEGRKQLLEVNTFEWTPEYQLFATNSFAEGLLVKTCTSYQPIMGGQECVLDQAGCLKSATGTPDGTEPFYFKNKYGLVHPGVNMVENGAVTPIYVAPLGAVIGVAALQPIEKVRVWVQQNIISSTMISEVKSNYIDVDFTSSDYHELTYSNEKWIKN